MTADRRRPRDRAYDCLDYPNPAIAFQHHLDGVGAGPAMQLVTLVCPAGHTLGLVITDDTGAVRLVNDRRDPAGPRLTRTGDQLAYRCHACRRAGPGPAVVGSVALRPVLELAAALAWTWRHDPRDARRQRRPLRQEATAEPTRRALRRALAAQLAAGADDRDRRRAFRDRLIERAGVSPDVAW